MIFFNDTATTEIYTLSLHDALPILAEEGGQPLEGSRIEAPVLGDAGPRPADELVSIVARLRDTDDRDRKSTRLNSSHANISYAVFCLKKKNYSPRLSFTHCPVFTRL